MTAALIMSSGEKILIKDLFSWALVVFHNLFSDNYMVLLAVNNNILSVFIISYA